MNSWPVILTVLAASACLVRGQLAVELEIEQHQFLPHEDLILKVKIHNRSGRTLRFGQDNYWLNFSIESSGRKLVPRRGDVPVAGEFELENSMVGTRTVNLAPYYDLTARDHYTVTATVAVRELNQVAPSTAVAFDIISGTVLWETEAGMPVPGTGNDAPLEVRRYALLQVTHLRSMKLYARVTDQSGQDVYRIFPLGPMVSFTRPEKQLDKESRLHVLYQSGARSFHYFVLDPSGNVVGRQTHLYAGSRPRLAVREDGEVRVLGGARMLTKDDLPIPTIPVLGENVPEPKP